MLPQNFACFRMVVRVFDERSRDDRAKLCTFCTCTREYRLYQKNRCRSVDRVADRLVSIVAPLADRILGCEGFPRFYVSCHTDSAERGVVVVQMAVHVLDVAFCLETKTFGSRESPHAGSSFDPS